MNCCDANGNCKGGTVCALGTVLHKGTTPLRFAPGAVESYRRPMLGTPGQRRELVRWVLHLVGFGLVILVCALLAGVIVGRLA